MNYSTVYTACMCFCNSLYNSLYSLYSLYEVLYKRKHRLFCIPQDHTHMLHHAEDKEHLCINATRRIICKISAGFNTWGGLLSM